VPPERVIRDRRAEPDLWRVIPAGEAFGALPPGPIVVPLAAWRERRAELAQRRDPLGVWLAPEDDPAALRADFDALALIAVHFARFTDGRGYSAGVLLRRYGYRGELRAMGDVGRDQLLYLERCGFDSFGLRPGEDVESALDAFIGFSVRYQGSVDDPVPLFRRRFA
jgi:uncharacterized protein (DUF934 family)